MLILLVAQAKVAGIVPHIHATASLAALTEALLVAAGRAHS